MQESGESLHETTVHAQKPTELGSVAAKTIGSRPSKFSAGRFVAPNADAWKPHFVSAQYVMAPIAHHHGV